MAGRTARAGYPLLRFLGRLAAVGVGLLVISLVGFQFARAIGQDVAMANELHSVNSDIDALRVRREEQRRELRRLEDPEGAIPEIHDRLRLVRPNEAIIFVSPAPAAAQ